MRPVRGSYSALASWIIGVDCCRFRSEFASARLFGPSIAATGRPPPCRMRNPGAGSRPLLDQQTEAPAQVVRHRREPHLQSRLGQAEPPDAPHAVAPLAGAEHLLDAAADPPDGG